MTSWRARDTKLVLAVVTPELCERLMTMQPDAFEQHLREVLVRALEPYTSRMEQER